MAFIKHIPNSGQTDAELVLRFKESGDLKILGELYQRHMEMLYGVCLKYMKDPETARDSVMQLFEQLIQKLKKHDVENFKNWIYQVAKNHCLMQLRTPKNLKTTELPQHLMQTDDNVHLNGVLEKEEEYNKLEHCINSLPDDQKKMIELFYLKGKCYNEIVEITGCNWNQVRSHIQNGRRNLKTCMEKQSSQALQIKTNP